MSNFVKILLIFLVVCTFSLTAFSQQPGEIPDIVRRQSEEMNQQKIEQDLDKRSRNLEKVSRDHIRSKQEALINARNPKFPALTAEQRAAIKEILAPNPEDLNKYKQFLQKPDTGIFRLFSDFDCIPEKGLIRVDGNCADLIPDSWFYSFRQKDYSDDTYFDVHLKDGNLISDGLLTQGIMVALGDIPLENISLTSNGINYLTSFQPKTNRQAAISQYKQVKAGVESDNFTYSNKVKVEENMTYVFRIAAYRYKDKLFARFRKYELTQNDLKFLSLEFDKRKDLILAFRVIRKSENGVVTILWKKLQETKSPVIVFQENEQLADIK